MVVGLNTAQNILSKIGTKAANAFKSAKVKPKETKPLFCHEYWKACKEQGVISQTNADSVSMHGRLNGINHFFVTGANPKYMDSNVREMVRVTDMEFKELRPTEKILNVTRCIGEKPDFFSEYKLYAKRLGIKKGDIIDMKEYPYSSSNEFYARGYLGNNRGIVYEIEVPKGSRVSRTGNEQCDEVVFPRSSKFECLKTERIKDNDNDYLKVNLRYIQPDEPWRNA